MKTLPSFAKLSLLGILSASSAILAHASTITVDGTDVIYAADTESALASSVSGTAPVDLSALGVTSFTFSVSGTVILNVGSGSNVNDADGVGAAVSSSSSTGYGNFSGITLPDAGALVGLFVDGTDSQTAAALNYTTTSSESSLSYSPTLDQVFFIGDGLTGDGTGSVQTFVVPTGATALYLGISDACGYNGAPGCYGDNSGAFTVTDTAKLASSGATPEPSSLVLLGTGILGLAGAARRRFAVI